MDFGLNRAAVILGPFPSKGITRMDGEQLQPTNRTYHTYTDGMEIMQMEFEDEEPEGGWLVSRMKCISCFKEWVAIYPFVHDADLMECPRCGKMAAEKREMDFDDDLT